MVYWAVLIFLAVLTAGLTVAFALEMRAAGRRQRAWLDGEKARTAPPGPTRQGAGATNEADTTEVPVPLALSRTSSD